MEKYIEKVVFIDYFGFNSYEKVSKSLLPTTNKAFSKNTKMGQLRLLMDAMPLESL
jgi:hypothetical protein